MSFFQAENWPTNIGNGQHVFQSKQRKVLIAGLIILTTLAFLVVYYTSESINKQSRYLILH